MKKFNSWIKYGVAILFSASLVTSCAEIAGPGAGTDTTTLQVVNTDTLSLGMASTFAVFGGGAGITNQGLGTVIVGDMGTTGISGMITGFHSSAFSYTETPLNIGAVTGTIYTDAPQGTVASKAIADATIADMQTAFDNIAAITGGIDPGSGQLGGLTLAPGVYKAAGGAFLITGGDLTLDGGGDTNAVWVFQMASSLTVGDTVPRSVILVNGAQSRNVYWQVGSAATINGVGGGTMEGTIISSAAITFSTAGNTTLTRLNGRALALNASITMVNTVINVYGAAVPLPITPDPVTPHLVESGTGVTTSVITLGGFINVVNDGGAVAATMTGAGTMNIDNAAGAGVCTATQTGNGTMTIGTASAPRTNAGALTVTITGDGATNIVDTGTGALTVTNTGNGPTNVTNTSTAAATVTNTGNGSVTITISGSAATTYTHTGDASVNITCTNGTCI